MPRLFIIQLLLLIAAIAPATASPKGEERCEEERFLALIDKYDYRGRPVATADSASVFWEQLRSSDPTLRLFLQRMERNGDAEKRAIDAVRLLPHLTDSLLLTIGDSLNCAWADSIALRLGFDNQRSSLIMADHKAPLAYTALRDYGYSVLVNSGLRDRLGDDAARCIIVREYIHGFMLHHLQQEYAMVTRNRRGAWIKALLFTIFPYTASLNPEAISDYRDIPQEEAHRRWIAESASNIDSEIGAFSYPFCDELQLQADILGYRFMEQQGLGDTFIATIELTGIERDRGGLEALSDFRDRATNFRIRLLHFMRAHPDLERYKRQRHRENIITDDIYR